MSDVLTALNGRSASGAITVADAGPTGMITIRGALDEIGMAVSDALGLGVPDTLGVSEGEGLSLLWMSPDELLVICGYDAAPDLAGRLTEALSDAHSLVAVVSDARSLIALEGPEAALRETLAKLTPADMSPGAFGPGIVRRTRLAQVAGAVWLVEGGARVICFRSVSDYVFGLLEVSARDDARVGVF
ncbi:sarcosine oxidase subunit gamma [Litorisediminicola beolgyonensis]|uniref:Sarcosine oxidase subunit gamma n=1 Tax=Litorisediminicola beolgyonensis TaxID=1173614 RepID=A0ABW3ZJ82_9RHOB